MNLQEAFDRAARGVISQGRPSMKNGGDCSYRSEVDGVACKCNVGWLINDDDYKPEMDDVYAEYGTAIDDETIWNLMPEYVTALPVDFLSDMQTAHDEASEDIPPSGFVSVYKRKMAKVAREYGLNEDALA